MMLIYSTAGRLSAFDTGMHKRSIQLFKHSGMPVTERGIAVFTTNDRVLSDLETPRTLCNKPPGARKRPGVLSDRFGQAASRQRSGQQPEQPLRWLWDAVVQYVLRRGPSCLCSQFRCHCWLIPAQHLMQTRGISLWDHVASVWHLEHARLGQHLGHPCLAANPFDLRQEL